MKVNFLKTVIAIGAFTLGAESYACEWNADTSTLSIENVSVSAIPSAINESQRQAICDYYNSQRGSSSYDFRDRTYTYNNLLAVDISRSQNLETPLPPITAEQTQQSARGSAIANPRRGLFSSGDQATGVLSALGDIQDTLSQQDVNNERTQQSFQAAYSELRQVDEDLNSSRETIENLQQEHAIIMGRTESSGDPLTGQTAQDVLAQFENAASRNPFGRGTPENLAQAAESLQARNQALATSLGCPGTDPDIRSRCETLTQQTRRLETLIDTCQTASAASCRRLARDSGVGEVAREQAQRAAQAEQEITALQAGMRDNLAAQRQLRADVDSMRLQDGDLQSAIGQALGDLGEQMQDQLMDASLLMLDAQYLAKELGMEDDDAKRAIEELADQLGDKINDSVIGKHINKQIAAGLTDCAFVNSLQNACSGQESLGLPNDQRNPEGLGRALMDILEGGSEDDAATEQ